MTKSRAGKSVPRREIGDKVVVEAKISRTTRTGGVPLGQDVAAVYTFKNGRIRRIEESGDVASAHAAASASS